MAYQEAELEIKDRVAVLAMNNPDKLNPFSIQMGEDLIQALYECEYNDEVRTIVFTGRGRAFSAGGDIKSMKNYPDEKKAVFLKEITRRLHATINALRRIQKPVIAAVNGFASGAGFSLALSCDMVLAAEDARFNLAYVQVGLHPDGGSTYFLPRIVGIQKTLELYYTGSFIDAVEAVRLNLVNRVVPKENLMEEAVSLAGNLAKGPAVAMGLAKETVNRTFMEGLEGQLENERQAISKTSMTQDFLEGIDAFFGKRKPEFQGK
jgi:2-(1,2-epoxy-1,2-dihydrophenyl)acetyl-CoA isomerase